jgi:hypothetical protein
MAKHKVITTDEQIETAAKQVQGDVEEPRAESADLSHIDGESVIVLKMSDSSRHYIPKSKIEGVADIDDGTAAQIEITQDGYGLRWPAIDLDLYVPYLLQGIYGTKRWMAKIGQLGGKIRSEAKCKAARENGRRGGRPRKRSGVSAIAVVSRSREQHLSVSTWHSGTLRIVRRSSEDFAVLFTANEQANACSLPRII